MKMNKKLKIFTLLSFLSLTTVGCGNLSSNKNSNSSNKDTVLPADDDLTIYEGYDDLNPYKNKARMQSGGETPDPFVYRFNGMYYMYITTGGSAVRAYKSSDLIEWEYVDNGTNRIGYCYEYSKDSSCPPSSQSIPFAPEIIYYNGKFYMVFSPNGAGHYILESDSPEGPFQAITGNVGKNIDGHFFIDKDENIYFYGASSGGIYVTNIENDFKTFKGDTIGLSNCKIGNWTEGPYMLNRNGEYYLTYCGTHYLSANYRIDYSYGKSGSNLLANGSYDRKDTVLLSTDEEFNGLGHSSTVLGPDMDSYYIVYHNLEGYNRYFNLSRLSFNGSTMVANDVRAGEINGIASPDFSSYDLESYDENGDFYLSNYETKDDFTCEFNTIGEGKMIFSYVDSSNYSYIEFKDNKININSIEDGKDNNIKTVVLNNTYDTTCYHSFRLQYKDGQMNFYFDNIEKIALEEANFNAGKIGYLVNNNFDEIGYSAFSNVALGSSDKKAYSSDISLANAYDDFLSILNDGSGLTYCSSTSTYTNKESYNMVLANNGDRATYKMQTISDGCYNINLRVPSSSFGKKIGLRIDNEEIIELEIPSNKPIYKKGDTNFTLDSIELTEGPHHISLYNIGDEVSFSEIEYELTAENIEKNYSFDSSFDSEEFLTRGSLDISNDGFKTNGQSSVALVTKEKFTNMTTEIELEVLEEMIDTSYASIIINATDFSNHCNADAGISNYNYTFRGLSFQLGKSTIEANYIDFDFTSKDTSLAYKNVNYSLNTTLKIKIEQENNTYTCYFNGEKLFTFTNNLGNVQGSIGLLSSKSNVSYKRLAIY